jgi:hypothetical protein
MSALVLVVFICLAVGMISARVQTHARWHREQPDDQRWVDQLKSFNTTRRTK